MTAFMGPVCFMVAVLAVLLWAAGLVPGPLAARIVVGSAAFLLAYAAADGILRLIKAKRRPRVVAVPKASYLLGTAAGPISAGDLVRIDAATMKVTRVASLDEVGGPVQ